MTKLCKYNVHEQRNALEQLRALGSYGRKINLAVLDGAIDTNHSIFNNAHIKVISDKTQKPTYHGTAVAGIIVADKIGISPLSNLISIPVFNEDKQGNLHGCSELKLAHAINIAREKGCNVINISGSSLSQTGNGTDQLKSAIETCLKNNVLIIAAIGNHGLRSESIPASMDGVIAVGAHDINGNPAQFNNFGTKLINKMILAPGVDIPFELQQGKFAKISGTSFAAPIISSVVALIIQAINNISANYTTTEIQNILNNSSIVSCNKRNMIKRLDLVTLLQQLQDHYPLLKHQSDDLKSRSVSMKTTEADSNLNETNIQPAGNVSADNSAQTTANSEGNSSVASHSMPIQKIDDPASNNFVHGLPSENRIQPQSASYESNIQAEQKVFALGEIGYDFLTESNLDYFQQAMQGAPELAKGTGIPSDEISMAKFLNYSQNGYQPYLDNCSALTWTLKVDGIPVYAIRPQNQFAIMEFAKLVSFLIGKHGLDKKEISELSSAELMEIKNNQKQSRNEIESDKIDIISIAGSIVDEVRLYNGHVVPVVSPILRGMFGWAPVHIANALYHDVNNDKYASQRKMLTNFLERVYYELRNRGASPEERAMNYAATNAYQAGEIFEDVLSDNPNYVLNKISTEKSPVCRPDSDCWDVLLEFFDPHDRMEKARKIYRYTIDVSGLMPVTFGKLRSWYAY